MRVRVWAYRDGTLLPEGYESGGTSRPAGPAPPFGTVEGERAAVDALVALAESAGLEVCIGTDAPGEFNEDVEGWHEV